MPMDTHVPLNSMLAVCVAAGGTGEDTDGDGVPGGGGRGESVLGVLRCYNKRVARGDPRFGKTDELIIGLLAEQLSFHMRHCAERKQHRTRGGRGAIARATASGRGQGGQGGAQ